MKFKQIIFGLLLMVLVSACAGKTPLVSSGRLSVIDSLSEMPAPVRNDLVAEDRPSLIGPLDTIRVDVFDVPELSREVQVDASGRIAMPLIGTLDAGGKTAAEVAELVAIALRGKYVRNPDVTINLINSVSQVVTVDGQVTEPGLYPVTNQMTLMRAVASAQGLSEFADLEDVVVLRIVNGQKFAGLYNIAAIRRGVYADPPIYANDLVIVGDSPQRRLFQDFLAIAPLLAAPVVALLQQ
ncbi:MAG: polysaccharide biosynthesis/export family protein [Erythrobacter sp.]